MVVLSNRQLGPLAELLVSEDVAAELLRAAASAARPQARARWEVELVRWLELCAERPPAIVDVGDIAWTPDHFETQRGFLVAAIERAAEACHHAVALGRWRQMIEAHPREAVQVKRRWQWDQVAT